MRVRIGPWGAAAPAAVESAIDRLAARLACPVRGIGACTVLVEESVEKPPRPLQIGVLDHPHRWEDVQRELAGGTGQIIAQDHRADAVSIEKISQKLGLDAVAREIETLHGTWSWGEWSG